MELEPHEEESPDIDTEAAADPIVLAYKIGAEKSAAIRIRRSELRGNPDLVEVGKSAQSLGFDPEETLSRPFEKAIPPDIYLQRKIQLKLMAKEIRRRINTEGLTLESLPELRDIGSINDPAAHYILTLVTDQLAEEGLWRDEDKDLTMSEAFPLSQSKAETRLKSAYALAHDHGTFLSDADLTFEDVSSEAPQAELPRRAFRLRLPQLATPMLHNLMRANPRDLYHQVARRMIDTNYFEDHEDAKHLYRACFFASKGVEDERHFDVLMAAGLDNIFPHYTFAQYRVEHLQLRKNLRVYIERFFVENPAVKRRLQLRKEPDKRDPKNVWPRFFAVWNELTIKQKDALRCVYMDCPRLSKKVAAEKFGITIDSLISRLRTAIAKFKREFWEFDGMSPRPLARSKLGGHLTHNGLWRYESARVKAQLYGVDLVTQTKKEIEWRKLPRSRKLDWKTVARIKAEIIENCPIPHFHETEYFDGMKPTIISFSRRPGNFKEDAASDFNIEEVFNLE